MDSLVTFLVAITLLTISPGADTVLVIRNALRGGVPDGFLTTLGICSGLFVHATISAVGISLILLQSDWLFTALKYLGALYLIYLGFVSLRQMNVSHIRPAAAVSGNFLVTRSLREGLLSNLLNPKPIIFYMAILPQFINPDGSALGQSLLLALMHFVISMFWLGVVALSASKMRIWISSPAISRWMDGALGLGLCGFGAALGVETYRA